MSLNNDYFVNITVQQHRADLVAEAENDRLARLARSTRTPGGLRRLLSSLIRRSVPAPAPVAPPTSSKVAAAEGTDAKRELVGAGRAGGA
jgi:hypothetical protein